MSDTRFVIPGFRSTPEQRREAIALLNTVKFTIEQFEQGWDLYERAQVRVMRSELPREAPMAALEDFCASEGLFPSDLAAAAIYVRADPIVEARSSAVDLKAEYREAYASCILSPLGDNALNYPPLNDDELQEELALEN